jgi:hypothetical protein
VVYLRLERLSKIFKDMISTGGARGFARVTEALSFVQHEDSRTASSSSTSKPEEQRSLISNFIQRGNSPPSPSSGSRFSALSDYASKGFSAISSTAQSAFASSQQQVLDSQSSLYSYFYAALSFAVGAGFIGVAFLFLPLVVVAPQKFVLLLTLGSLFLINSVALLRGYFVLVQQLLERDRILFSIFYIFSLLGTLYVTIVLRSYFLTVIFSWTQVASLVFLLLSYITDASRILGFIRFSGFSVAKRFFDTGGQLLPL